MENKYYNIDNCIKYGCTYSRAIDQKYPRLCVICGKKESKNGK